MKSLFISGAFVPPQQGRTIDVVDPSTGEVFDMIGRASEELELGLLSIAVPVCGASGAPVAAVNVAASTAKFSRSQFIELTLPALSEAAAAIEAMAVLRR